MRGFEGGWEMGRRERGKGGLEARAFGTVKRATKVFPNSRASARATEKMIDSQLAASSHCKLCAYLGLPLHLRKAT